MFYRVLFPPSPCDPRHVRHASLVAFARWVGGEGYTYGPKLTEAAAAESVRERFPDAVGMPMMVTVGSGEMVMLGLVESIRSPRPTELEDAASFEIPFVAIVLAIAETTADKKPGRQFNAMTWSLPPQRPRIEFATHHGVEIRTSELPNPLLADVEEGADRDGRRILHVAVGGGLELSLAFAPPTRLADLRFHVEDEGDGYYARSDAFPNEVAHGASDVLALSGALDQARPLLQARERPTAAGIAHYEWTFPDRVKQEPWAIGKRVVGEYGGDGSGLYIEDAERNKVIGWHELLRSPECAGARGYLAWQAPPDWPGVVTVMHPAAWSAGGAALMESLARRFQREVHVIAHGSKWLMVFVGEPMDGDDLYSKEDCQWWAKVDPHGKWQNIAAS